MVLKDRPNLPLLTKIRYEHTVKPVELEILSESIIDDTLSVYSSLTLSILEALDTFDTGTDEKLMVLLSLISLTSR